MPSLAEIQRGVARAVLAGEIEPLAPLLVGGVEPCKRLEIHRRHYEGSLAAALRQKFPATEWLIGAGAMEATARAFALTYPPLAPCIAEYGAGFPAFVARRVGAELPYLEAFAALEWEVGRASIAVDREPLDWSAIAGLGPDALLDARLALQSGLAFLRCGWRVDRLLMAYITDSAPERFVLSTEDAPLEVRGVRGSVSVERLDGATYEFRRALASNSSIGESAARALERDASFDAGRALRVLAEAGLVTALAESYSRDRGVRQ
jgi:hypothetical protein